MKNTVGIALGVLLLCSSSSLGAFHEGDHGGGPIDRTFKIGKTGEVNFGRDVKIGNHLVKRGKYLMVHRDASR
jgi:hypothetical protein